MKGQIIKIISNSYFVNYNNVVYIWKAKGKFRYDNIKPQVGDYVYVDTNEDLITEILPRKNSLERPNVSNIDQAFIVTSLKEPDLSLNLLDKFLVICESNKIIPIICFSKKDLLTKKEFKKIKPIIKYYKKIGYQVLFNSDLGKIKHLFNGKTTVFTGQTGAGKSTLINKLNKDLNFATGSISKSLGRGKHTTRYVTLVELYGGKVLDTPGFSSLDLSNLTDEEIRDSFIEFRNIACDYKNCMHINESNCNVKKLVSRGIILESRYDNYKKFIEKR